MLKIILKEYLQMEHNQMVKRKNMYSLGKSIISFQSIKIICLF